LDGETVVGMIHAKEFAAEGDVARVNWHALIRPVVTLQSKEPIISALRTLQNRKSHLGVVLQRDSVIGIVTIADILEEIVGDMYDEDDSPQALLSLNSRLRTLNLK